MNNTSHNPIYSNPKLDNFLGTIVDEKSLAQSLRRAAYLIALSYIRSDEYVNPMNKEWTDDIFYFINELAECLDPVLENQ